MKKKITGEDFEKLGDDVKALYKKEGDGNFYLEVDESEEIKAAKEKTNEFRQSNIALKKRVEEFEKKYKDLDPEKYAELMQKMQDLEDKKLLEEGDVDKLVEQKTERMVKDYEAKIESLSKDNERLGGELSVSKERLSRVLIDSRITEAVAKVGAVRMGAMKDVVNRGREVWVLGDDGEPVAQKSDGTPLFGKDAAKNLTFDEWAEGLATDAAYLFEPSEGLQSPGGGPGGGKPTKKGLGIEMKDLPPTERLKRLHKDEPKVDKLATG